MEPSDTDREPANNRQTPSHAELSHRRMILVAAASLCVDAASTCTTEDLVVRCWVMFPTVFGLRGHPEHADSNKVLAKLAGPDGLCGLGWMAQTAQRTYRVTRKGRGIVAQLSAIEVTAQPSAPTPLPALPPPQVPRPQPPAPPPTEKRPPAPREPRRAAAPPAPSPGRAPPMAAPDDVAAIASLARCDALRRFLRGSPLRFDDACALWGVSQKHPKRAREKVDDVGRLLERVVERFGAEGAIDPRLPPLSTCYGLLNLHRLMLGRFARELEALAREGAST